MKVPRCLGSYWFRLGQKPETIHALDGTPRRDGKNGWKKGKCEFSRTGWAWVHGKQCSCQPAKAPREEK